MKYYVAESISDKSCKDESVYNEISFEELKDLCLTHEIYRYVGNSLDDTPSSVLTNKDNSYRINLIFEDIMELRCAEGMLKSLVKKYDSSFNTMGGDTIHKQLYVHLKMRQVIDELKQPYESHESCLWRILIKAIYNSKV